MAAEYSSSAVTMGHLALKRAIRHAEANNLVSRNVAAPKGQEGRLSKPLTVEQTRGRHHRRQDPPAIELHPGLKDVRRPTMLIYPYIVLSLLAGLRTEEARALSWQHVNLDGDPKPSLPFRLMWPYGDLCACTARPRPSGHA